MKIEDYGWKMRTVMHIENDQVVYDAVSEPGDAHSEAKVVDMTLEAKDGKLLITDATNDKTYEGTYKATKKTPAGTDYEITIDGMAGYATVAVTAYADGAEEPTLPITLDGYSMYFYGE